MIFNWINPMLKNLLTKYQKNFIKNAKIMQLDYLNQKCQNKKTRS